MTGWPGVPQGAALRAHCGITRFLDTSLLSLFMYMQLYIAALALLCAVLFASATRLTTTGHSRRDTASAVAGCGSPVRDPSVEPSASGCAAGEPLGFAWECHGVVLTSRSPRWILAESSQLQVVSRIVRCLRSLPNIPPAKGVPQAQERAAV